MENMLFLLKESRCSMIPYERQKKILSIIEEKELVKIDELQKIFKDVSVSTLRRDLKELERNRKIESFSGGAVKKISTIGEIPIITKNTLNSDKKEKIAQTAAELVTDGDTIYVDSGSTCTLLLKYIIGKNITIYTTNTDIFSLGENVLADIFVIGGKYKPITSSLSGPFTEDVLKNLYFNKSFLGVNGLDEESGVTTPTIEEATKKRMVKNHSDQVYLLCDSSKFHKLSNVKVFDLDDVIVISDKNDTKLNERVSIITEL